MVSHPSRLAIPAFFLTFLTSVAASDVVTSYGCENGPTILNCPGHSVIEVLSANYGRTSMEVCNRQPIKSTNCRSSNAEAIVRSACNGMSSCAVIASNGIFGDPCGGTVKYLEVAYRCIYGDKRRVVGCENSHIEISCGAGEVVELEEVLYGRTNAATCNRHPILTNSCGTPAAKGVLQKACNGMSSCSVPATNGVFGDPCVGTVKYLDVTYKCRKDNTIRRLACENDQLNLNCAQGQSISVIHSNYGRTNNANCPSGPIRTSDCHGNSLPILQAVCNGIQTCSVRASNAIFGDPCIGTHKYLEATYTCERAEIMRRKACENEVLDMGCGAGEALTILKANYGRTEGATCPRGPIMTSWCIQQNTLPTLQSICESMQSCQVPASNAVFGDPCVGTLKYLDIEYKCQRGGPQRTQVCESNTMNLACPAGHHLEILRANYGRTDGRTCSNGPIHTRLCYASNSLHIIKSKCEGRQSCSVSATNSVFTDPCPGTYKYLDVKYKCNVPPTPPPPPPTPVTVPATTTTTTSTTTTTPTTTTTEAVTTTTPKPKPAYTIDFACENETMEIECEEGRYLWINWSWYGRIKTEGEDQCPKRNPDLELCNMAECSELIREKCEGRESCTIEVGPRRLAEPCDQEAAFGRANTRVRLEVNYTCSEKKRPSYIGVMHSVHCQGDLMELDCSEDGSHVAVTKALYSPAVDSICSSSTSSSSDCPRDFDAIDRVAPRCNGKTKCSMRINEENIGKSCANGRLDVSYECSKVPTRVRDLFIYKKSDKMIGLAWSSPLLPHGLVVSYRIAIRGSGKQYVHKPVPCIPWPTMYCYSVTKLDRETNYTFEVSAKNDRNSEFGVASVITGETVEQVPKSTTFCDNGDVILNKLMSEGLKDIQSQKDGKLHVYLFPLQSLKLKMESKRSNMFYENKKQETTEIAPEVPLELTVTKTTETSLGLKWKPPRRANGILRSFLVKIDQTSSYDPEQCCRAFPMKEIQVTEEEIEYSTEVTGLISGSTYAVSVSGVTAWLGPSAMMTASTRPPKPSDIPLPQVHLNIQQPIEWKPTSQEWPGNYIPLIRCNLLLLMTDMVEEKESDLLDVVSVRFGGGEEDEADDDLPPRKEDDVGTLTSLIRKELNGANFKVLALYHADEDIVLDDIGTGPVATQCGLTADSRTILKTGHKYRLAAVQIVQYKGLYNVAAKITKPFVTT